MKRVGASATTLFTFSELDDKRQLATPHGENLNRLFRGKADKIHSENTVGVAPCVAEPRHVSKIPKRLGSFPREFRRLTSGEGENHNELGGFPLLLLGKPVRVLEPESRVGESPTNELCPNPRLVLIHRLTGVHTPFTDSADLAEIRPALRSMNLIHFGIGFPLHLRDSRRNPLRIGEVELHQNRLNPLEACTFHLTLSGSRLKK